MSVGDPLLRLLQAHYGHTWRISRTECLWIAVAVDTSTPHATTIVHEYLDAFLSELESPPQATGPRASLVRARYFADRAERHGSGTWWFEDDRA